MKEETKFKLFCASNDNTYSKLPAQYGLIARDLYKDGADWYRNNVWHDASEDVGTNEPILVLDEEGRGVTTDRERLIRGWGEWGKGFCRWAYVEDLLPDNCINKKKEA